MHLGETLCQAEELTVKRNVLSLNLTHLLLLCLKYASSMLGKRETETERERQRGGERGGGGERERERGGEEREREREERERKRERERERESKLKSSLLCLLLSSYKNAPQ